MNVAQPSGGLVADLRHQRREIRRELARVRWWRNLLRARRDVSVAALAQPESIGGISLDAAWEALAADAPTVRELKAAVWPHGSASTPETLTQLDTLDTRLEQYESRVLDSLESVTAQLVSALRTAERVHDARERDFA